MVFKDKAALFLATGGPVGRMPFAPGTFGSLLGLIPGFWVTQMSFWGAVVLSVLIILLAVWSADAAEKALNQKDPGRIVIDEIAGMTVAMVGIPFSLQTAITAFVLFRILDITKPFPIRYVERRLSGGVGVVMDDVLAGVLANIALRVLIRLVPGLTG